MYDFFKGTLAEKQLSFAVIEVAGIGYRLHIPSAHFERLPEIGSPLTLFTAWVIRELSHLLYGFFEKQERDLFEQLLAISGIGPKTALALIGHYAQSTLETIVFSGDIPALAKVPGIGKKTAEKLIVDLKGRFKTPSATAKTSFSLRDQDALSALIRLGCSQIQAEQALKRALQELTEEADLPTLITAALKFQK